MFSPRMESFSFDRGLDSCVKKVTGKNKQKPVVPLGHSLSYKDPPHPVPPLGIGWPALANPAVSLRSLTGYRYRSFDTRYSICNYCFHRCCYWSPCLHRK
jgi:hypothetical protein